MKWLIVLISVLGMTACHTNKPNGEPSHQTAPTNAPDTQMGTESSGGGSFLEAKFREVAKIALQDILLSNHPKASEYYDALRPLIENEETVKIVISPDPLKHPVKGEVDALNFRERKEIDLYQKVWKERLDSDEDIRYLVLHEFFGLTDYDDTDFRITLKIFPATGLAPDYESTHADCQADAWGIVLKPEQPEFYVWPQTFIQSHTMAPLKDASTNIYNRKAAELVFSFPGHLPNPSYKPNSPYKVAVNLKLVESSKDPRPVFYRNNPRPAFIEYKARLIDTRNNGNKVIAVGTGNQNKSSFSEAVLINLQLEQAIENEGISRLEDFGDWGNAWSTIRDGLKSKVGEEKSREALFEMLKDFPLEIPMVVTVSCMVGTPEQLARKADSGYRINRLPKPFRRN